MVHLRRTKFNKGYAFVNMTSAPVARRLHAFLHGHSWAAIGSGKVCEVVHSDIQVPTHARSSPDRHYSKKAFLHPLHCP